MAGLLEYTKNGQVTEPPLYRFMRGNVQSFLNSIPDPSKMTPEQQLAMGLNANPIMGLLGTTAYHGSPYLFEQFDPKKIGTGVGNQYYGRGTYFTESPEVAKSYQAGQDLNVGDIFVGNKKIKPKNLAEETALQGVRGSAFYEVGGNPIDAAIESFSKNKGAYTDEAKNVKNNQALDYLLKLKEKNASFVPGGTLYKVDIPDEYIPKMLDFDKPLYKQSNEVKQLAMEYKPGLEERLKFTGGDGIFGLTGSDLFNVIQRYKPKESKTTAGIQSEEISNMLLSKGIPGNQYLDTGAGARNYVVFDPSQVKILEKGLLNK